MGTSQLEGNAEKLLIEQARQGRLEAFNQLVLLHQASAYHVAYRILGDPAAAADATQDGFLKAYKGIAQYGARGTSFRAWLMRIVINTCYDALRKRRRERAHRVEIAADDEFRGHDYEDSFQDRLRDPGETPEEYALRRELAQRLHSAIARLPFDQRTAVVLSDVEGFAYDEIAQITGVPIGTVKSRLARARAHLRQMLEVERHFAARERAVVAGPSDSALRAPGL